MHIQTQTWTPFDVLRVFPDVPEQRDVIHRQMIQYDFRNSFDVEVSHKKNKVFIVVRYEVMGKDGKPKKEGKNKKQRVFFFRQVLFMSQAKSLLRLFNGQLAPFIQCLVRFKPKTGKLLQADFSFMDKVL